MAVGTVTFYDGGTVLGSAAVNPARVATLTVPTFAAGTHWLRAIFHPAPGSPFLAGATAMATTVQVSSSRPIGPIATATTLTATPLGPVNHGRRSLVRFGVRVTAGSSNPPSGLVELLSGGQVVAVNSLDANGEAMIILPGSRALRRPFTALYLGGSDGTRPATPSRSATLIPTPRGFRTHGQSALRLHHGPVE